MQYTAFWQGRSRLRGPGRASGQGGARPRRGGNKGGPESPTNRPAYGGRATRPQGAAVGRTAASLAGLAGRAAAAPGRVRNTDL